MSKVGVIVKKWADSSLVVRILIGLVIGAVLGLVLPGWKWIGILGTIFVGALKAIAPVLVGILVTASVAKAGSGVGVRFRKVIGLYLASTLTAALIATLASTVFPVTLTLQDVAEGSAPGSLADIFRGLLSNIVANPVWSLANANYVGILFWAILTGLAIKMLASQGTVKVVSDLADAVTIIVKWIIQFAPFGIMGLVFAAVSENGLEIFTTYGRLILLLAGCMVLNALVMNPLWSFIVTRRNPYPLLWTCLKESGLNAFFTRSSAANIPINMALCQKLGLDKDFYSVSIPLGATINMNGAAVTITVMTMAVAHTLGIEVGFVTALLLGVIATFGACGASGVAGGSLLLIPM
ncbi:MAG: serine/threonine transporter SstT, partial [Bacteroidales bacterium]|nr:serine/threonine transporter SstT [Bacteroidales bacterium]